MHFRIAVQNFFFLVIAQARILNAPSLEARGIRIRTEKHLLCANALHGVFDHVILPGITARGICIDIAVLGISNGLRVIHGMDMRDDQIHIWVAIRKLRHQGQLMLS